MPFVIVDAIHVLVAGEPWKILLSPPPKPTELVFEPWAFCLAKSPGLTAPQEYRRPDRLNKLDCGEDAFLIARRHLAVADGVGGWRSRGGIDPSVFPNELMRQTSRVLKGEASIPAVKRTPPPGTKLKNSNYFLDASTPLVDPVALLDAAYKNVLSSGVVKAGTSTAAVAVLEGTSLRVANLGDSGVLVQRGDKKVFRTVEQQHRWNCPFQFGVIPTGSRGINDPPTSADGYTVEVQEGDIVVLGTDGLFDNMFDHEIAACLADSELAAKSKDKEGDGHSSKFKMFKHPDRLAAAAAVERLVKQTKIRSKSNDSTPFSVGAQDHGKRHVGGKRDDITAVVAKVVRRGTCSDTLK